MILINAYRRPQNEDNTKRLTAAIERINLNYKDTPIVIFADFNYPRDEIRHKFKNLTDVGFKFIYSPDPEMYTRSQKYGDTIQQSYLDYFLIKNIGEFRFTINEPIGNSDHRCLSMDIHQNDMRIKRRIIKERKFSMINEDPEETGKLLLKALKDPECVAKCGDLVESRRTKFPPLRTKLKSHFKVIEKLNKSKNWDAIKAIIKKCSEESYHQFMSCFEKLRITQSDKEYSQDSDSILT